LTTKLATAKHKCYFCVAEAYAIRSSYVPHIRYRNHRIAQAVGCPITDTGNWPRCIQIAWQLHDEMGKLIEHQDYLVKPQGFNIPYDAERIHGISTELADAQGVSLSEVLEKFNIALSKSKFIVGQNLGFDINIMGCEFFDWVSKAPWETFPCSTPVQKSQPIF
jgi:hypothetical protein